MTSTDSALAYETHASGFLKGRDQSSIGATVVRRWAASLDSSTVVLEIGCGGGLPITRELVDAGLSVWAIDSSPSLLEEFSRRFPEVDYRCEKVQNSTFFSRSFGAIVAVGVVFLLPEDEQFAMFRKVASSLEPSGCFLFTAPLETGSWQDNNTGIECRSVGVERYRAALVSAGFADIESFVDSGKNHYYACRLSADESRAPTG